MRKMFYFLILGKNIMSFICLMNLIRCFTYPHHISHPYIPVPPFPYKYLPIQPLWADYLLSRSGMFFLKRRKTDCGTRSHRYKSVKKYTNLFIRSCQGQTAAYLAETEALQWETSFKEIRVLGEEKSEKSLNPPRVWRVCISSVDDTYWYRLSTGSIPLVPQIFFGKDSYDLGEYCRIMINS